MMNREQVIELMQEAGLKQPARGEFIFIHWDQLAQLIEYEREECAKVCESHGPTLANGAMLANAIRERGNNNG